MPTKKTKTSILDESFSVSSLMSGSDSYKSLIYGIVTVVVLFVVIALGIRSLSQNRAQIDKEAAMTQNTIQKIDNSSYKVQEGDSLWSIAEKSYNDGFKWHLIAEANNITEPYDISIGTTLIVPSVDNTAVKEQQSTQESMTSPPGVVAPVVIGSSSITGTTYTVVHGDNLWDIAVRAYGDGYRWTDIANANKLENPGLIFSGNVLNLPRP
jgi:nucleoid-associated protein YgaU